MLRYINIPAVTPAQLIIKWVDVDPWAVFAALTPTAIEMVAAEGWLEPAYLQSYDAGHTKFFVRRKPTAGSPPAITDAQAHANNDPYLLAQLSLASFASNIYGQYATDPPVYMPGIPDPLPVHAGVQITYPIQLLSREGVGIGREDARWSPPDKLFLTEPLSLGFATTNIDAILHARLWVRLY